MLTIIDRPADMLGASGQIGTILADALKGEARRRVETPPLVITKNGPAAAVLLAPVDDDDLEGLLLARSPRFQAILNRSRRSVRSGRTVKHKEFWKPVAKRQKKMLAA